MAPLNFYHFNWHILAAPSPILALHLLHTRASATLFLMCGLLLETWIRLVAWMVIGLVIYFASCEEGAKRAREANSGDR